MKTQSNNSICSTMNSPEMIAVRAIVTPNERVAGVKCNDAPSCVLRNVITQWHTVEGNALLDPSHPALKPVGQSRPLREGTQTMIALAAFLVLSLGGFVGNCVGQENLQAAQVQTTDDADDPLRLRELPDEAKNIGVDSHIGDVLQMDVVFHDTDNNIVRLKDLVDGKRPVMLSFNYSDCPKLCSVQLENMTSTLRELDFTVGTDFQVVSISIDPNEQTSRARATKEKFVKQYNRPGSEQGWHFLTGDRADIRFIADQCGFRYKYVAAQKLYSHPPVFILISPQGKIVRYIHGLDYQPETIKLALVEAAEGKIGSPINILSYGLGCFSYNSTTGQYTFQAMALMRIGGLVTVAILILTLVPYWFFRRGKTDDKNYVAEVA